MCDMIYVERLLQHPIYLKIQKDIPALEAERVYCRHEFSHSLDVCRIAWILFLEEHRQAELSEQALCDWKERIYLTGLLHDVGRATQYQTGEHHGAAGRRIAMEFLADIGCPSEWIDEILLVVALHFGRDKDKMKPGCLGDYICRADHLSRNCFLCEASETCKWEADEMNTGINV